MNRRPPYPLLLFLLLLLLPLLFTVHDDLNTAIVGISLGLILDLFCLLIAFLSSIYFFALYIYDFSKVHNLFFSLFCCTTGLLGIFYNDMAYNACLCICLLFILLYSRALFPTSLPRRFVRLFLVTLVVYLIFCILLYHRFPTLMFSVRLILQFLCSGICLYISILQILKREKGSRSYLVGGIVLLLTIIPEFMNHLHLLPTNHYLLTGLACFIVLQVNSLIKRDIIAHRKEYDIYTSYMQTLSSIKKEETNLISSYLRPHFLFNALNIIGGYCLIDTHRAKELTIALMTFLTQLFEHDNLTGQTPLDEEIALMQSYGMIQAERFTFLTITYDIPEQLPPISLPSLTLQPLLDNAINHGVRKKNSFGEVNVTIRREMNELAFSIKDTGIGIESSQLPSLLLQKEDGQFHSLFHISARLMEQYHNGLHLQSSPSEGTTVEFLIPLS